LRGYKALWGKTGCKNSLASALYSNSWVYFLWVLVLHPIWHRLVKKEETALMGTFG